MFKGLGNLASMLKQAQQLGSRMQEIQAELRQKTVVGAAGGDMVEIELNGLSEVRRVRISPQLLAEQDRELTEDLVAAALKQALEKSRQLHTESISQMAGGINVPGLQGTISDMLGGGSPSPDA